MRLRLWHRWFALTAALLLLAVGSQSWLQQQAFRRGLVDYLNRSEQLRLEPLAGSLAGEYLATGSFARLRDQRWRWQQHIQEGLAGDGPPAARPPPPPPSQGRDSGPRPPPRAAARERRLPPPPAPPPPAPRRQGLDLEYPRRLSLLDADGQTVIGSDPTPGAFRKPIVVDGRTVGWLVLAPLTSASGPADREFVLSQARGSLALALGLLGLAVALSVWMARHMLRRMAALTEASRQWAAGHYAARADERGRDELSELAADFNRMAEAQSRSLDARNRWMADISHELRTPVAILRGELQALQDGIRPLDRDALNSLAAETERLARRIAELQDLARSDGSGMQYRFHRVECVELVRHAVESQRGACVEAGLEISLSTPATCWIERGDPDRLDQLVGNLLSNSRRYTDAPGRIAVSLDTLQGGRVRLRVEDSAPGVPESDLNSLFARHWRAEEAAARAEGSGLGLALCRNIVEAHGGRISASSSELGGLRIEIELGGGGQR